MISLRVRSFLVLLSLSFFLPASPAAETLRVMSYNIHHGEGLDQKIDLERIAKLIVDAKADLVGLQEVDRGVERSQKRDLPAELARLTGLKVEFRNNQAHQGGEYGNAILSRFPIKQVRNTHLKMAKPGEQRGLLQVVVEVNGRDVLFMNTHLDHRADETDRLSSVAEISAIVRETRLPVILVGDFNAVPESRAITQLRTVLTDVWPLVGQGPGFTIPVRKPNRRIDYIWVSDAAFAPVDAEVLSSEASDHLPLVATLRFKS